MQVEHSPEDLKQLTERASRNEVPTAKKVWHALSRYRSRWIRKDSVVLDLGCGWCEFINSANCRVKYGMDLNPDAKSYANQDVIVLEQDCSAAWDVTSESLDVVFTSNFLEHLPAKSSLEATLREAFRALKPEGRFIAMGPNIKHVAGAYWDFFDHYLALTELSLGEVPGKCGFQIEAQPAQFLPYTMSHGRQSPVWMLRLHLTMPFLWRLAGGQFLVIARKPITKELAAR